MSEILAREMRRTTLVSSVALSAPNTDPKLLMPVDLALVGSQIWVTSRMSSLVCKYDHKGCLQGTFAVPSPTGICTTKPKKCHGSCNKSRCACATTYVASANGNVYKVTGDTPAIYVSPGGLLTGVAWMDDHLYVVDNQGGYVAVYADSDPTKMATALADDALFSVGYKPYGIRTLGCRVYITYSNMSTRQGAGYIDVYDAKKCSNLIRIINRENLSLAYGLTCGTDQVLVVGNAGSGYISQFALECQEATYTTNLKNLSGGTIVLDGVMGMERCGDKIYYVASSDTGGIGSMGVLERC